MTTSWQRSRTAYLIPRPFSGCLNRPHHRQPEMVIERQQCQHHGNQRTAHSSNHLATSRRRSILDFRLPQPPLIIGSLAPLSKSLIWV
nr:hypothetical protein [uncultured Kingella sp.]